ncbi:PLP-dependent aminotransferase family protein [Raineyella sp. LH-20]|uniref:aminotransferase-like domain-containing protein n=1 Tax=Raineyella sp. LH-20 TaxID=3081204 RepID=UPI00295479FA|nr:PLP-dependent aminotransferase family protein [Raineyella sp. LH-20]WOP20191.1 PLP-dependent aminotransferase family protein [Raineyella sp. LH-20]
MEPQRRDTRLDLYHDRYAARAFGMKESAVRALFAVANRPEVVSLAGGMPNIADLPLDVVANALSDMIQSAAGPKALQYGSGQGEPMLREQICEVMAEEGIKAHPDDVTVTVGSQQGLDLVTRIFCDPGDVILAEAPSYVGALSTFASYETQVVHVEMDEDGLVPERLREAVLTLTAAGKKVKFLYTIPNYSNPSGITMTLERRKAVLEVARETGLLVVEDNPYGLLDLEGERLPAIRSMESEQVLYLGSFSKTFSPGFRVGWVLAPHAVREKLVLAQESATLSPPTFSQYAVSTYLKAHDWRHQIDVFRNMYRERRDAMLKALPEYMPAGSTWTHPRGGFFIWLTLPAGIDSQAMLPRAVTNRVAYTPGTAFYADDLGARNIRLSYCYPTPERIREGVRRLGEVLNRESQLNRTFGVHPGATHPHSVEEPTSPRPDQA